MALNACLGWTYQQLRRAIPGPTLCSVIAR
jgi:hypothetical protein